MINCYSAVSTTYLDSEFALRRVQWECQIISSLTLHLRSKIGGQVNKNDPRSIFSYLHHVCVHFSSTTTIHVRTLTVTFRPHIADHFYIRKSC